VERRTIACMDMRRVLVMIVVGMLILTALAGLSAPTEQKAGKPAAPPPKPAAPQATVSLRHPPPRRPPVRKVRTGARVVLNVSSATAGQVEVDGLGLVQAVAPAAPVTFDVIASRPGRYQVVLLPVEGDRRILGTLVVG
jgi:hypothetical protein